MEGKGKKKKRDKKKDIGWLNVMGYSEWDPGTENRKKLRKS